MIGCLFLHGFTGSPFELEPLSVYLKEYTDWKICVPVLPGHGDGASLKGIKYTDWLHTAEEALIQLMKDCSKVYVVGFSMGGIIACYLAAKYEVAKIILLSAAALYLNPRQIAWDSIEILKDAFKGKLKENELYMRYKSKIIKTPVSAAWQFRKLVKVHRSIFKEIKIPAFIAQGVLDGIVPPRSAEYLYNSIPSKEKNLFLVTEAKHLICHCDNNKKLFKEVYKFLTKDRL